MDPLSNPEVLKCFEEKGVSKDLIEKMRLMRERMKEREGGMPPTDMMGMMPDMMQNMMPLMAECMSRMGKGFGGPGQGMPEGRPGFGSMMGPGMPMMRPGGPGMGEQQFGPPPEISQRELRRMQKEANGLEKILTMVKNQIAKAEAKGVTPSQECKDAVDELSKIINAVKSATLDNWMEVGPQMMGLGQIMPQIEKCVREFAMVSQSTQVFKQAEKFIGNLENQVNRIEPKALEAGLNNSITEIKSETSNLRNELNTIKEQFKTDTGAAIENLPDWFESARETQEKINNLRQIIPMLKRVPGFLKSADSKEKMYTKKIAALEKKGEDVVEAKELLEQLQDIRKNIEAAIREKDFESVPERMADYFEIARELEKIFSGGPRMTPAPFEEMGIKVPEFNVPRSFEKFMQQPSQMMGPQMGPMGGSMMGPGGQQPGMMPGGPGGMFQFLQQMLDKFTPEMKANVRDAVLKHFNVR
jgi:hypothetical protein